MEHAGLHARQRHIERVANSILSRREQPELPISAVWATRFLQRYPEYFVRTQRTINIERKEAHNREDIKKFYEKWDSTIKKHSIAPSDIYNIDKTSFRISIGRH